MIKMNASIAANFFLKKGKEEKIAISLMKLLKLVFIGHGWCLVALKNDEGILNGEKVEAWKFGPVIPSLYHEFKHFKNNPIRDWSETTVSEGTNNFDTEIVFISSPGVENRIKIEEILSYVWTAYQNYDAWELSEETHEPDTPWAKHYQEGKRAIEIPNSDIRKYYEIVINKEAKKNDK